MGDVRNGNFGGLQVGDNVCLSQGICSSPVAQFFSELAKSGNVSTLTTMTRDVLATKKQK
jgi:hypothetical protein